MAQQQPNLQDDKKSLGPKPYNHNFLGFDHIRFLVNNAQQAAGWYAARFGFEIIAYRGLETQSREMCAYVLRQNQIVLVLECPLQPCHDTPEGRHITQHGDGVRDVAFQVDDARAVFEEAKKRGAVVVQEPCELKDEDGVVVIASVRTYGDTVHSFIERTKYKGIFMPGYKRYEHDEPLTRMTPSPNIQFIDHVVGNQPDQQMLPIANWYEQVLQWHRFWTVDDSQIHTDYSALRSIVMADWSERLKMPINEPAQSKKAVSQIQEYVDYYGGPGVQHIALHTLDIIHTVSMLKQRGLRFLTIPPEYYDDLREKLKHSPVKVEEDMAKLQELSILIDHDEKGYLLQIFTVPVEDRPTLFFEIIQRHNHNGFGAGNFKALFVSIEEAQKKRGNLWKGSSLSAGAYGAKPK